MVRNLAQTRVVRWQQEWTKDIHTPKGNDVKLQKDNEIPSLSQNGYGNVNI